MFRFNISRSHRNSLGERRFEKSHRRSNSNNKSIIRHSEHLEKEEFVKKFLCDSSKVLSCKEFYLLNFCPFNSANSISLTFPTTTEEAFGEGGGDGESFGLVLSWNTKSEKCIPQSCLILRSLNKNYCSTFSLIIATTINSNTTLTYLLQYEQQYNINVH